MFLLHAAPRFTAGIVYLLLSFCSGKKTPLHRPFDFETGHFLVQFVPTLCLTIESQ